MGFDESGAEVIQYYASNDRTVQIEVLTEDGGQSPSDPTRVAFLRRVAGAEMTAVILEDEVKLVMSGPLHLPHALISNRFDPPLPTDLEEVHGGRAIAAKNWWLSLFWQDGESNHYFEGPWRSIKFWRVDADDGDDWLVSAILESQSATDIAQWEAVPVRMQLYPDCHSFPVLRYQAEGPPGGHGE